MLSNFFKKSYVYILLIVFYIPLMVGVVYSMSRGAGPKTDMPIQFEGTFDGWKSLSNDSNVFWALMNSLWVALVVAGIVVVLSLLTTFSLWRQKNKSARPFVVGTSSIPLINPDIITGISLAISFGVMFGAMQSRTDNYARLIFSHVAMILPFAITLMLPRSDKFKMSLMEASKDLGFGPISTWLKTYLRHMIPISVIVFGIAMMMSLDDFVVGRIVFKTSLQDKLLGKEMYEGKLHPWVLALGTIMLAITLSGTAIFAVLISKKERKLRKVKNKNEKIK